MIKLKENYHLVVRNNGELIGRFVNKKDAERAIPKAYDCFFTHKLGKIIEVLKSNQDYLKKEDEQVCVYQSYEEFNKSEELENE